MRQFQHDYSRMLTDMGIDLTAKYTHAFRTKWSPLQEKIARSQRVVVVGFIFQPCNVKRLLKINI